MRAVHTNTDANAWIATDFVEAPDFLTAFNTSRPRLLKTVDALCVVTQCSFSLIAASWMVYRLTDNADRILYFRHLRETQAVGMPIWKDEQLNDVTKLVSIDNPGALHYFREAVNAATHGARLAMLVITAEALAGQRKVTGKCQHCGSEYSYGGTNRDELEAILGTAAYSQLYKRNGGSLRHRLLHGIAIDENLAAEVGALAYDAILEFLKKKFGLSSIEKITAAPRPFQNAEWFGAFLRCTTNDVPELPELEQNWQGFGERVEEPAQY